MNNKLLFNVLVIVLVVFIILYIMFKHPEITLIIMLGTLLFIRIYEEINYKKNGGE